MGQVLVFCWDIHRTVLVWDGPVEGREPSLMEKTLVLATIPKLLVGLLKAQESFTK